MDASQGFMRRGVDSWSWDGDWEYWIGGRELFERYEIKAVHTWREKSGDTIHSNASTYTRLEKFRA